MLPTMLKAIIFDMDGVLLESEGAISKSFNMVLKKHGVKLNTNNRKKYLGRSLRDQLTMWKKEYPKIPKDLDVNTFSEEALQYQIEILGKKLAPNRAILNLIKEAKRKKIRIAVATSSSKKRARIFLNLVGILNKLDALVTADDVKRHKPHPDIFLKAAALIKVPPTNCVVIEDAVNGIRASNRAKMKSVALITRNHSKKDFGEANYVFSDFNKLKLGDLTSLF